MFRTIRWRLVASFMAVTLLTVALIGVLALALFQRQTASQEQRFMLANADAVARQAESLIESGSSRSGFQRLAETASFLSGSRIRILDHNESVLADSGLAGQAQEYIWLPSLLDQFPGIEWSQDDLGAMLLNPSFRDLAPSRFLDDMALLPLSEFPPGTEYTVIRQVDTPWGQQMVFETRRIPEPADAVAETDDTAATDEPPAISVRQPIGDPETPIGYVELSSSVDYGVQSLATARRAFLLAGLGATVLALLAGLVVSQSVSAPISELSNAVARMSSGNLDARAPVHGKDEIGQLAQGFNEMADRLQASFGELAADRDALRRFIADASHELRTPITALKGFNDLLRGPAADDDAARAEFMEESAVQIERLEWITGNLLNLSRLDAGLVALDLSRCQVAEVIASVVTSFRPMAEAKHVVLTTELSDPDLAVQCDRMRIELAMSNLVDNALKFTPPGGMVGVGADRTDITIRLWVTDTGTGIDPADQPHVLERFYRSKNSDAPGSGLGLAIVQGIVQAHGGWITVTSQPGHGSRFTVELPGIPPLA